MIENHTNEKKMCYNHVGATGKFNDRTSVLRETAYC